MIDEGLDDIEDAYYGALALEAHLRSGLPAIYHEQLVKKLGLDT